MKRSTWCLLGCIALAATVVNAAETNSLSGVLTDDGYLSAPLGSCGAGQYCVDVTIQGKHFTFLVDTGASFSLVDPEVVEQLKLPLDSRRTVKMVEMTGKHRRHRMTQPLFMHIGSALLPPLELVVVDLKPISMDANGESTEKIHGIVGSSVLKRHAAIIDYRERLLYLRDVTRSRTGTN